MELLGITDPTAVLIIFILLVFTITLCSGFMALTYRFRVQAKRIRCFILKNMGTYWLKLKERKISPQKETFKWKEWEYVVPKGHALKGKAEDKTQGSVAIIQQPAYLFYNVEKAIPLDIQIGEIGTDAEMTAKDFKMLSTDKAFQQGITSAAKGLSIQLGIGILFLIVGIMVGVVIGLYVPHPAALMPPTNGTVTTQGGAFG